MWEIYSILLLLYSYFNVKVIEGMSVITLNASAEIYFVGCCSRNVLCFDVMFIFLFV